jgi:hypothetical protein
MSRQRGRNPRRQVSCPFLLVLHGGLPSPVQRAPGPPRSNLRVQVTTCRYFRASQIVARSFTKNDARGVADTGQKRSRGPPNSYEDIPRARNGAQRIAPISASESAATTADYPRRPRGGALAPSLRLSAKRLRAKLSFPGRSRRCWRSPGDTPPPDC